ncbi:hypothetical protein FraQA3DRAFT_1555 [Frankia sp. QA3]|nr:hypothetical protein FraQA3DRAFT_1555 [Frankia sp. QA3]
MATPLRGRAHLRGAPISAGVHISGVCMSPWACELEAGGLLRRSPDPDARGTLLSLTEDGEEVVGLLRRRLAELLGRRLVGWSAPEAEAFVAGLERFVWELRDELG